MKTTDENKSLIDTSGMSKGQRAALEMAEDSRDTREISGFAGALFMGNPDFSRIAPFPTQRIEDKDQGDPGRMMWRTGWSKCLECGTIMRRIEAPSKQQRPELDKMRKKT